MIYRIKHLYILLRYNKFISVHIYHLKQWFVSKQKPLPQYCRL